jgi:DNA repair photolyase
MPKKKLNYFIDRDRVLISMGGPCAYHCRYCYTQEKGFSGFPRSTPEKILSTLQNLPPEVKLIKCGYDNEFFQDEDSALKLIEGMANLGRNISFATKKDLSKNAIRRLQVIMEKLKSNKNYLVACVSILGLETAKKLEPDAPDPERRIRTVQMLHQAGIPVLVYLRPLFPMIPDAEIEEVIARTKGYCKGYVVSHLICDEKIAKNLGIPHSVKRKQSWSLDRRDWFEFLDPRTEELLKRPDFHFRLRSALERIKH